MRDLRDLEQEERWKADGPRPDWFVAFERMCAICALAVVVALVIAGNVQ